MPLGELVLSGNRLYGATAYGGAAGKGTVFAINTDGSTFTIVHDFVGTNDGAGPQGPLVVDGNRIYGFTLDGTIFRVNTDGTGFTNLHSLALSTTRPGASNGLILSGNTLFGSSLGGGAFDSGTIFSINTDGTGFINLHDFAAVDWANSGTNIGGASPQGVLVLSSNILYGTAYWGGRYGSGIVYRIGIDGSAFTVLHDFTQTSAEGANTDGAWPASGLILISNMLYGTTSAGGSRAGSVFRMKMDGSDFQTLFTFDYLGYALDPPFAFVNSFGANPTKLLLSGNILVGSASGGGEWGVGTLFGLKPDGTINLFHVFTLTGGQPFTVTNVDGENPNGLLLVGQTMYGTTQTGGASATGTIFSFSWPQVTISRAGGSVILSWPTSPYGFRLQSSNDSASLTWEDVTNAPRILNDQYIITNQIKSTPQFFRLAL